MTDPTLAIEKAVLDLLRLAPGVVAMVADRVFDVIKTPPGPNGRPMPDPAFPYIELGDGNVVPDPADGFERSVQVYLALNAYSRASGRPEVRKLCGVIVDALSGAEPDLGTDLALCGLKHDSTRYLVADDGLTHHGVVTFVASIDPV